MSMVGLLGLLCLVVCCGLVWGFGSLLPSWFTVAVVLIGLFVSCVTGSLDVFVIVCGSLLCFGDFRFDGVFGLIIVVFWFYWRRWLWWLALVCCLYFATLLNCGVYLRYACGVYLLLCVAGGFLFKFLVLVCYWLWLLFWVSYII